MDAFKTHLLPTPTATHTAVPIPSVHPDPPIFQHAGATGHRTLWVVFVLMVIASLSFAALGWTVPASKRLYHSITTTIVVVAALSYFAMATGAGKNFHHHLVREKHDGKIPDTFKHVYREVYYARYIDWLITTPLLLLDLGLLAGLNGASLFSIIVSDIIMIVTGLFAAYGHTATQKWGWYAIGDIAYIWILYVLLTTGRQSAHAKGSTVSKFYTSITVYTLVLWTAYPIIWALADGSRRISVDAEIVAFAVLDVLAKGVFGAWLLFTHARVGETHADVGGFWANGLNSEGRIRVGDDDEGA